MEQQITVSCLGRPMALGMLYDCRSDQLISAVTLWDVNTLRSNSDIRPCESSKFDVTADDSMENKAHSLNIEADVKLSFLGGLFKVGGAAQYLDNNRSSANKARVVLKYSCKSSFEQLAMDHLGTQNIQYHDVFDKDMATHVVTGIEYGADAFFVFDRQESNSESRREVEGKLATSLSKISGIISVDGSGSVQMNEEERKRTDGFKCTFHGDIVLRENPTTFDDAVEIYKKLPTLIQEYNHQGKIYGIPKRAYLYPLSRLDNRAAKLVRSISNNVVDETQSILEHIIRISAVANDLENSDICQKFQGMKQQVAKFKSLLSQFQTHFQKILCEMLPKIRGGGMEESQLLNELNKIKSSPYNISKLNSWLDLKKCEFACLECYLKDLKEFPSAFQAGELQHHTQTSDQEYILCFSFGNITSSENSLLDVMEEFFSVDKNEDIDNDIQEDEKSWCDNDKITADIRNTICQFKEFAAANKDKKNIKFIIVDVSSKRGRNTTPCSIILYSKNPRQIFQPPNAPGQPQMISNAENEITIKWTSPTLGEKNVVSYNILYQPVGTIGDSWSLEKTKSLESQFTVKQLNPGTEYLFKIEAVCEIGKSQPGPESLPMKTKSPPPLAMSILDQCKKIAEGKNGKPTWYQLPRPEKIINKELRLKRVDIGSESKQSQVKPHKIVLMVGATGAGKSTLVNGMINYLYGVKNDDPFRLQLIPKESSESQAHSQTSDVTQYILHWQQGIGVPYNVVFIDTPGFGDTRGIEQDAKLMEQLRIFFEKSVSHIDIVGFVVQSSLARLTDTQKYIFDGILSIFGKDIEKNIFLMVTFADSRPPPVLSGVKEFNLHYEDYFKFNNSVFTMESNEGKEVELNDGAEKMNNMFWDMAYEMYKGFFEKLKETKPESLQLTQEVLVKRKKLEDTIEVLTTKINYGINQLATMRAELPFIIEYEAERDSNKDYKKIIDVPKTRRIYFTDGHFVTNCEKCSQTCHNPCQIPEDSEKHRCGAMGKDGNCKVCKNHCYWNVHCNRNYIFEEYTDQEEITMKDMERKYKEANSNLSLKDNLLMGIWKEYDKVQKEVLQAVVEITECLERLDKIAMRPDPLSVVQYIEVLMKAAKRDQKPGWEQRLDQLENARKRAIMIQDMKDKGAKYDPFKDFEKEIKQMEERRKTSTSKGLVGKVRSFFGMLK